MTRLRLLAGAFLLLLATASQAFDFKSIGPSPAILYDAPSVRASKLFVAPPGMPVEVILNVGEWTKVRDVNGDLAWVEAKALSARRTVVVRNANARLRASGDDNAATLMLADKHVLLELVDPQAGPWIKVRHRDGPSGYVKAADVWGI